MKVWNKLLNLLPARRRALEADMREELEALRGLAHPGELGNLTRAAENARAELSWPRLERIAVDFRTALRALRRSPGYAIACVLFLALGIGVNTAMFSVVYAVVLKPLPYPNTSRLVFLWEKIPSVPEPMGPRIPAQRIVYDEWRRLKNIFSDMAAWQEAPLNEGGVERPGTLSSGYVSANLFPLLGARAGAGRLFRADEDNKGRDRVVILSDAYFDRRFHRNPEALGKTVTLGGADYIVIGTLPAGFHMPATYEGGNLTKPDVWIPLSRSWNRPEDDTASKLFVIGLLNPGISLTQARSAVSGLQARLNKSDPERYEVSQASVFPLTVENRSEDLVNELYLLLGAVGLLLTIGCTNLASLTLARATRRAREISVRWALGASRLRIIRQLLTESFLLSVIGACISLVILRITIGELHRFELFAPRPDDIQLNWVVFAFAAGASLLTTALFGLAPAIAASNIRISEALKSKGGGGASAGLARSRQILTTAEVSLAVLLLCGSGLLIRSFINMTRAGLGFRTERLAVADIDLPGVRYPDAERRARFYDSLLVRARAIPGVVTAAVATTLPLKSWNEQTFRVAGQPRSPLNELPVADVASVSDDYFGLMGLSIRAGRKFMAGDALRNRSGTGEGVVIVNGAFAAKYFRGQNPVGRRLLLENDRPYEIVGVSENFLVQETEGDPHPQYFEAGIDAAKALLLLRTAIAPTAVFDSVRATLLSIDPELPVNNLSSMEQIIRQERADARALVLTMGIFAGLALLLAMIGVYVVLTHLVASQTREIGIRMALGATPANVGLRIARETLKPLAIGLISGLTGSLLVSRAMESFLIGIAPTDPVTYLLAAATVLVCAPPAVWWPVRRATRIECTVALREE